jgi:hypothetical protein
MFYLSVHAYLRDDCHPGIVQWLGSEKYQLAVDRCPVRDGCYIATFHQGSNPCDVFVHPANTGVANLGISSDREIGGAQGRLVFDKSGLRVDAISSPYAGSILKWDRTADGANFVLVVPPDSIPPSPPGVLRQLLNVTIAVDGPPRIGEVVRLTPVDLLVSDADGQALPFCPSFAAVVPDPSARICSTISCDVNYDAKSDVRDLVLLVNCLARPPGSCQGMDCDFDYDFDLDDVMCCARAILDLGVPPDSVNAVPAPEVTLAFGTPVLVEGGVDLPVMVGGIGRIGAARLEFSYPEGVFASASVELNGHPANWLALDQASGGRAVFGGIRLAPGDVTGALPLTLHLRTRAGQQVAGTVSFVAGQFSDGNGATLVTSARPITMPIGGGGNIVLRAAWPNPFGAETHFGVGLAQVADLDIGMYDIAGRRVATLFKGRAAAGTHEITWRRTRDDGSLVPSGVYFYRIVSGGVRQGGKVLVLPRD